MKENKILVSDDVNDPKCEDFTLRGESCWITVGGFSVYLIKHHGGMVRVEAYNRGCESDDPIFAEVLP